MNAGTEANAALPDGLQDELVAMIVDDITFGEPVEPSTDLLLTGMVDSIGVIKIVGWLEERLDIEIDAGDVLLEHFQTVAQMMVYLAGRGGPMQGED